MYKRAPNPQIHQKAMYGGNHSKALHISVHESLQKLRTSYIDILYVHFWDYNTSVEEVMNALHNLVVQGKVLYLGISDAPAWVVSKANQYARDHGKTPFVIYQGAWNVMQRDFERDIIPMARSEGLALAPWNVLAGGHIRTDEEEERRRTTGEKGRTTWRGDWERTEKEKTVCKALEKVAAEVGTEHIQAVAIAYLMQKTPYVFPLVGGRKVEHLMANIEALGISLMPEQIQYIESVVPFDLGFPHGIIGTGATNMPAMIIAGHFDRVPIVQAIRPQGEKPAAPAVPPPAAEKKVNEPKPNADVTKETERSDIDEGKKEEIAEEKRADGAHEKDASQKQGKTEASVGKGRKERKGVFSRVSRRVSGVFNASGSPNGKGK
ncbi:Aldo/keto reductase [Heliocybe sulcata]|uniref:Aldo/keto reductase n=1 Tax=Heliocybe sulcata TaxID=5364 RepID=A0A5C3MXZ5_9AGAM|nr:Aldo/keto reductase [Heliocybe sulcata]